MFKQSRNAANIRQLPPKTIFSSLDSSHLESRRAQLEQVRMQQSEEFLTFYLLTSFPALSVVA